MTPEELIGRVKALEWLLTTLIADGIARSPLLQDAAKAFQSTVAQKAASLVEQARALGDTPEAWALVSFADALVDLGHLTIHTLAAGMADPSGPRI